MESGLRLIDYFDRGVRLARDRTCVEDATARLSYAEVQRRSYKSANAFAAAGFGPGRHAGVLSPNAVPAFEALIGAARAGVTWVPINGANGIDENVRFLDDCDVEMLFYHSAYRALVETIRARCAKIALYVCIDRIDADAPSFDAWIAAAAETDPDLPLGPDHVTGIASSGGTTGRPKGIVHTQAIWATVMANVHATLEIGEAPVHLAATPMSHASGVLAIALLAKGAHNILMPRFDAAAVLDAIAAHGVTHLFLPPTAINLLLAVPGLRERRFPSLRELVYAGSPMAVDKLRSCVEIFGPVMVQSYGQAEAPMFCTILTAREHDVLDDPTRVHRLASCGRATLMTPVAIMADDGRLLPAGERDEIVVRGGLVTPGYYKNAEATAEVSQHGWHHTGDIGLIDDDGYVYIVDRKKDMIITGGFNVYPNEIEQVIFAHPAIQDCAVIGVPDDKWGEAVKAVVELLPGARLDQAELIDRCKAALGSIKAPKTVEIWDRLPRTPNGKVSKKEIRETFWQNETRRI
jgi:acyl-CoA synthetase (AMP-forming)/AMP-acid ligase II